MLTVWQQLADAQCLLPRGAAIKNELRVNRKEFFGVLSNNKINKKSLLRNGFCVNQRVQHFQAATEILRESNEQGVNKICID